MPSLSGLSIAAATRKLERSGFTVEKRYTYSDTVPKYGFMGWSPGPGSTGSRSSARCTRMYSNGRDPAVVAQEKADAKKKKQQKRRRNNRLRQHALPAIGQPGASR